MIGIVGAWLTLVIATSPPPGRLDHMTPERMDELIKSARRQPRAFRLEPNPQPMGEPIRSREDGGPVEHAHQYNEQGLRVRARVWQGVPRIGVSRGFGRLGSSLEMWAGGVLDARPEPLSREWIFEPVVQRVEAESPRQHGWRVMAQVPEKGASQRQLLVASGEDGAPVGFLVFTGPIVSVRRVALFPNAETVLVTAGPGPGGSGRLAQVLVRASRASGATAILGGLLAGVAPGGMSRPDGPICALGPDLLGGIDVLEPGYEPMVAEMEPDPWTGEDAQGRGIGVQTVWKWSTRGGRFVALERSPWPYQAGLACP